MANQEVIVGGAVVAGIVAILIALRPYLLHKKEKADPNHTAGGQNTAFWEKRFDKLDSTVATLDRIIREHRGLTQGEIRDIRDLLVEIDADIKVAIATRPVERRVKDRG